MVIGCKEHFETICPDFPDKCPFCGCFIDIRKSLSSDITLAEGKAALDMEKKKV